MMYLLRYLPLTLLLSGLAAASAAAQQLDDYRLPPDSTSPAELPEAGSGFEPDAGASSAAAHSDPAPPSGETAAQDIGAKSAEEQEVRPLGAPRTADAGKASVAPMSEAERQALARELNAAEEEQRDQQVRRMTEAVIALMQAHREIFNRQAAELHRIYVAPRALSNRDRRRAWRRERSLQQRQKPFDPAAEREIRRTIGNDMFFLLFGY